MLSFICLFCQKGEYPFHKKLVELVAIPPDPTPFCVSGNLPVDFNVSWLTNNVSGGKQQKSSVWKLPEIAHNFD